MATVSLIESAKLSQDNLISGVIENIVTVDRMFEVLPFTDIEGNSLAYNRELATGDAEYLGAGQNIVAKNAATFTQVNSPLTTLGGDAEVDGLIQASRSNINDQRAVQIASKAKQVGRMYRNSLINGTGAANDITGLLALVAASQTTGAGAVTQGAVGAANGGVLSFEGMDLLLDSVKDKDGQVDYIAMPSRTLRSYYALLRAVGGASIGDTVTLESGAEVPAYRGTPIFRNDNIPVNQVKGTATAATSIFAGTFDDGSGKYGISGLTAAGAAGVRVKNIGEHQSADMTIDRVIWYCGLANFSTLGLAALSGVTN
ncbi:MAG: phage major capsid protein [Ghiorsea sp.]